MRRVLIAWVGVSDLLGPSKEGSGDVGPVAQALKVREFDRVVLLENFSKPEHQNMLPPYVAWLKARTKAEVVERPEELAGPTDWGGIYKAALRACQAQERDSALTFHLSPGSPPMAAVWVLLGKTVFSAELIESSREQGVKTGIDLSAYDGVQVVVTADGAILTVYRNRSFNGLRDRRTYRRRPLALVA